MPILLKYFNLPNLNSLNLRSTFVNHDCYEFVPVKILKNIKFLNATSFPKILMPNLIHFEFEYDEEFQPSEFWDFKLTPKLEIISTLYLNTFKNEKQIKKFIFRIKEYINDDGNFMDLEKLEYIETIYIGYDEEDKFPSIIKKLIQNCPNLKFYGIFLDEIMMGFVNVENIKLKKFINIDEILESLNFPKNYNSFRVWDDELKTYVYEWVDIG